MKHRVALDIHARKLKEELTQAQDEHAPSPLTHSVLLPLPEIPSAPFAGHDNGSSNVFEGFRHLGLAYLDENGERLEFSAGIMSDDNKGYQTQDKEAETIGSESSDSESDATGIQAEWAMRESGLRDYWPYPSKTVSDELR